MTSLPAMSAETTGIRIPSVTRWVQLFSQLEFQLTEAVKARDGKTIEKLLSDNFEMRIGATPGNPIPRASWIKQSLSEPRLDSSLEQMAVHDYKKLAVVSFLWTVEPHKQNGAQKQIYIVDIWLQDAGAWKLTIRYASPGGKNKADIPAGNPPTPLFKKKM